MSFNFMAGVTICNDFGAQENKSVAVSIVPHLFAMRLWAGCHDFCGFVCVCVLNVAFSTRFFTLFFHFHQEAL